MSDRKMETDRFDRAYRNRQAMIERVRNDWIGDVLEQSLYHVARIELGLEEQPEAVERPWAMYVQEQGRPAQELPRGVRMSEVFDRLSGALLILGAPGTGKTTLLLELASDLLDRAAHDPEHPIPTVFNLSSWALRPRPLADWLIDELNERYDVPRKTAQAWVKEEAILPLLDGLDEVAEEHRDGCAEAINAWRLDHGMVPMAVCSRTHEYETLTSRLRLEGAVVVQSLTREQVDAYLGRAGAALAVVRGALSGDDTLYELLNTSLMLSVVTMAYSEASASILHTAGTVEERRERLLTAYVEAMHERRGMEDKYAREQVNRWLAWLAWQMHEHNQSVFLLERIQPGWLPRPEQVRRMFLGAVVLSGMVVGMVAGFLASLIRWLGYLRIRVWVHRLVDWLGGWLGKGLVDWLDSDLGGIVLLSLAFGTAIGLLAGLFGRLFDGSTRPAETLRWSWPMARGRIRTILGTGLILAVMGGIIYWLVVGPAAELGIGLQFGLAIGMIGVLISIFYYGLVTGVMTSHGRPNEGIRRSVQSALVSGLVVGMIVALFGGLFGALVFMLDRWRVGGLDSALYAGLVGGLIGGYTVSFFIGGLAWLQHYVLRYLLVRNDFAPWKYVPLLDYAAELILLRKVGGGYIFVHRLLLDWFAQGWESDRYT